MKNLYLSLLALIGCSLSAFAGTTHTFDSGGLQKVMAATIEVPGAATLPSSVTLKLRTMREIEGGAEATAGSATFSAYGFPHVEVYGGFGIYSSLPAYATGATFGAFDGLLDYAGTSGYTWSSGIAGSTVTVTITDPILCAQYVGSTAQIPLLFAGDYHSTWGGGIGTSYVSTAYAWSGTITYD